MNVKIQSGLSGKAIALAIAFFLIAVNSFAQQARRMYFIGNSVTDAMNYAGFEALVASRANVSIVGSQRIPGSPLSFLWENPAGGFTHQPYSYPTNAFAVYTWDVLSLQPFDRNIQGTGGDREMIDNFYNLMKSKSPDCKVFIYAHWPRTPGSISETVATKAQFNSIWLSQTDHEARKFYEDLTTAVRGDYPPTADNIVMVPIGEVMYELNNNTAFLSAAGLTSIWGIYSDGIHMKGIGSYITACTMYAMAYHDDPAGLGVPGEFGSIPYAALPIIHKTIKDVIIAKSTYTKISYFGPAPVLSVALNASAMELNVSNSATLTPVYSPSNAANKAVSWISSDNTVAKVNNGVVTAISVGTANITVTSGDGGFQSVCAVTVTNSGTAVSGISLNKPTTPLLEGADETLIATIAPANATNTAVIWTSSDISIATVDANGKIKAIKKGAATITATSVNGLFTANLVLTVTRINHPPVAVMKYTPGNAGYAPYKVTFDGRSSTDPDPDDFVLGFDWVIKKQGDANNLSTLISNGFDYTFTKAGLYDVTFQAADNDGPLRSLNTEKVTITVLDMPKVPVGETAFCYEGFDYVKAPINNFNGGRGWNGGWQVQDETGNTVNDLAVDNVAPVVIPKLRQVGNYMTLGQGYGGIGRRLDVSDQGSFKDYLSTGKIGKPGSTLWFSVVIRPMNNNKSAYVSLSDEGIAWLNNTDKSHLLSFGAFDSPNWGLAFGNDVHQVKFLGTVPVVNNTPAFLVAKIEFGAINTVSLYVNPAPGATSTGNPIVGTSSNSLLF